jgi:hypothetical protein
VAGAGHGEHLRHRSGQHVLVALVSVFVCTTVRSTHTAEWHALAEDYIEWLGEWCGTGDESVLASCYIYMGKEVGGVVCLLMYAYLVLICFISLPYKYVSFEHAGYRHM